LADTEARRSVYPRGRARRRRRRFFFSRPTRLRRRNARIPRISLRQSERAHRIARESSIWLDESGCAKYRSDHALLRTPGGKDTGRPDASRALRAALRPKGSGRARLFLACASRRGRRRVGAALELGDDRRRARVPPRAPSRETPMMFAGASSPRCCSASARAPRGGATRGRGRAPPRVPCRTGDGSRARARLAAGPRAAQGADAVSVAAPPDEQMARRKKNLARERAAPRGGG
jgi:hypothetical protein